MMIDKINIRELKNRYKVAADWLLENTSAPLHEYCKVANEMAVFSVRISIYYKKNKL